MVNAVKQISARERARAASLQFYEREKQRETVQLKYFASMESVDKVHVVRDREIAAAHERATRAASSALDEADGAIRELLALGVKRPEVQQRLGCTAADVRRATEATAATATAQGTVTDTDAGTDDAEAVDEAAEAEGEAEAPAASWRADRGESAASDLQSQG